MDTGSVVPKRTLRKGSSGLLLRICVPVHSCSPHVARTERGRKTLSQEWTSMAKFGLVHSELTRQPSLHAATGRSFRKLHREYTLTSQEDRRGRKPSETTDGNVQCAQTTPSSPPPSTPTIITLWLKVPCSSQLLSYQRSPMTPNGERVFVLWAY